MDALTPQVWLEVGPLALTDTVFVSGALTLLLAGAGLLAARLPGLQELTEVLYEMVESMLQEMATVDTRPVVPLVLTLWLFILSANLVGLMPIIASPTRDLSLTAALATVAFGAGHYYGWRTQGWGYLRHYIQPNPIMLPFNVIGEASRTLALALRLFGNMVSGEIIAAIVVSLAGLLLPVPLMLLDVLTSVVQAYIFGVLTLVFTASSMQVASRATASSPSPSTGATT